MEHLKTIFILVWWDIILRAALADEIPTFLATTKECITSDASAVAYNAPVDDTLNIASEFYPSIADGINCEIEDSEGCTQFWVSKNWKIQNSIEGPVKEPVTDWRWEAFPLFKTTQIDDDDVELEYTDVLSFSDGDFNIPFSVRTQKEAHVFLCEEQTSPHFSSCYWFMIEAFNGNKSALRRCESGYIDYAYGNWPKYPCKHNLKEDYETHVLSKDTWIHFTINKIGNTVRLIRNEKVLLSHTDSDALKVQHMFIHSKRINGLWKVHNYPYILTTTKGTEQKGPDIEMTPGLNCISMFVAMCSKCELTVTLQSDEGGILHTQTFTTEDEKWKQIKIVPTPAKGRCKLFIETDSKEDSGLFWAVDQFRRCSEKEYRILRSPNPKTPCQLVENSNALVFNLRTEIKALDANCPESTFGSQCIPCQLFGEDLCSNFKYCEVFNAATRCHCTAGYTNQYCTGKCDYNVYGHGCQQQCSSHCDGSCHYIDGRCNSGRCRNNFTGKKCDKGPTEVTDLRPVHISPTSIGLKWEAPQNWIVIDYVLKYRLIKGKACPEQTTPLRDYTEKHTNVTSFNLEKLNPYSSYEIIVYAVLEEGPGTAWSIPVLETEMLGKLKRLAKYFTGERSDVQNILDNFKTMTTVPNSITNVTVTSKDESSISFRWKAPYPPTGILKKYNITYFTQLYIGSKHIYQNQHYSKEIDPIDCKLWSDFHCATITDGIQEKGNYYYTSFSATNEFPLEYVKVYSDLMVLAGTAVPEAPYDVVKNWTPNNDLVITWKHPNSTNGLVKNFTVSLQNTNIWKKKIIVTTYIKSEDDYNLTYTTEIKHDDITPCSEYIIIVSVYNAEYSSSTVGFRVRSPPPIPPSMSEEQLETNSTNHTITIYIPSLPYNLSNEIVCQKKVYLFIADSVDHEETNADVTELKKKLDKKQTSLTHHRLLLVSDQAELPITFEIGDGKVRESEIGRLTNPPLEFGMAYNVSLFFVNICNKRRTRRVNKIIYTIGYASIDAGDDNNGLYPLILLIFLIPLLVFVFIYIKRKETMPDILAVIKQPQRTTVIRQPKDNKDESIALSEQNSGETVPYPVLKPRMSLPGRILPVIKTTHSKPIKLADFESYVKESIDNEELVRQHALFPRGQTQPWECGAMKVNKPKNRYNNLFAYDHTRVKLRQIPGVEHSDYINANYIDGYRSARSYIATQGPKACTLNDFWRMIWDENVKHIVMLANSYESGKKKVEKYWPDINEEKEFDGIRVQYISTEVFANYEFRVFNVYRNKIQRKVDQLHFTTWPDHGVPLYSQTLVPFLQRILKIPNSSNSPVVIHCSAGVGRTGTIILCDICLRMAAAEGSVDFLANLEHIRSQRANMVDNVEQYKLSHLVVLECLFGMNTSIPCNDDMDNTITGILNSDTLKTQLRYLEDAEWQDRAMDVLWDDEDISCSYPEKNRFQDIIPDQQHRVFLLRYPSEDDRSSYINAVQVDGFRSPGRFVVTQQPMPNTLGDFWRMVAEKKSTVIISLNEINKNDKTSCQFWPDKGLEINPVDYLTISHVSSTLLDCYRIITVRLTDRKENENVLINIVSMVNWMPTDLLPNGVEEFLSFWEDSDALARQSDPVIITCYNGATASGLYIATSFIIEKMKLEHECDVCLAVRTVRHNRRQFVTSEEQFEFLYRASLTYINGFESYANFA